MKKIVSFFLLLCMVLSLSACGNTKKEITVQNLYDASNVPALLEKYDSVHIVRTWNGDVYQEEYYSKEYCYSFYDGEINGLPSDNAFLVTDHAYYVYINDIYTQDIVITPDGMVDMENCFAEEFEKNFFSTTILNDIVTSVTEKDGQIIVTNVSDQEELDAAKAQGWTLGHEEYVLDAKTHEVISIKGVSANDAGETYEGAVYITYNAEIPEGMKKFVEYEQMTGDMRTITIVSNPGADNEKTESIQILKDMQFALSADWEVEENFNVYADAACTQTIEEEAWNSDPALTLYVKWGE